jgi:SAM-dependent methyltransferase
MVKMGSEGEYRILEAHCKGQGINLCCQHTQIGTSIGVDADPNARAAKIIADVRALPFRTGAWDYCICHHGLEHIRDAPLYVIHEWLRVIREGGTLALIVPDGSAGESALNYASFQGEVVNYAHGHLFTIETLKEIVAFAGAHVYETKKLIRAEHKARSLYIAALKTKQHNPHYQPFSKPIEAMRLLQKDGVRLFLKRLWSRL